MPKTGQCPAVERGQKLGGELFGRESQGPHLKGSLLPVPHHGVRQVRFTDARRAIKQQRTILTKGVGDRLGRAKSQLVVFSLHKVGKGRGRASTCRLSARWGGARRHQARSLANWTITVQGGGGQQRRGRRCLFCWGAMGGLVVVGWWGRFSRGKICGLCGGVRLCCVFRHTVRCLDIIFDQDPARPYSLAASQ